MFVKIRRAEHPFRWKKPKKIFVNSMCDLFHERVSDGFVYPKVWDVMRATPHHHYQILTKRPERMGALARSKIGDVLPNVWLGTSVENADVVDRVHHLRPSQQLSALYPLSRYRICGSVDLSGIHWAIVGGESGRSARPIREDWIDEIFDHCAAHNTAFFFKQWGTWGKDNKRRSKKANGRVYRGRTWDSMPTIAL